MRAPGIPQRPLEQMTPAEARFVRREVQTILDGDDEVRLAMWKGLMRAAGVKGLGL